MRVDGAFRFFEAARGRFGRLAGGLALSLVRLRGVVGFFLNPDLFTPYILPSSPNVSKARAS